MYAVGAAHWSEIAVDLFEEPLVGHARGVCANIERLPFAPAAFGAVICVGEVLGYCDPATAIAEFARVLAPAGQLLCDFGSTRSAKHWFTPEFGKATALVTDMYNDRPERLWNYNPEYIGRLLSRNRFNITAMHSAHTASALARRCGASLRDAVRWERLAGDFLRIHHMADLIMVAASKS